MTMRHAGDCLQDWDCLARPLDPPIRTHHSLHTPAKEDCLPDGACPSGIASARKQQLQSTQFKSWEQDRPAIPRRSRFYPLEPCGIGTPLVESLSSYLVRLSEVHAVSVGDFVMREL